MAGVAIPTGYEMLDQQIQQKRELAKAMLEAGLTPHDNYRSLLQPIGQLAQAWAGKSLQKDANKMQAEVLQRRLGDYTTHIQAVRDAVAGGATPDQIYAKFSGDPLVADQIKPIVDAYTESLKNNTKFGAPTEIIGTDGKPQLARFSEGNAPPMQLPGMSLPHKLDIAPGNGTVFDPMDPANKGKIFPMYNQEVYAGPDGKPVTNTPLVSAKTQVAAAGKPTTNTYVNAVDRSFGKAIPEATVADLTKTRDAATAYIQTRPELSRALTALQSNKMYSGALANPALFMGNLSVALGLGGKSTEEKVANSQIYLQNMARQMLPILQSLKPASDTDVKTASRMAGGDLSLDPKAMMSAIRAAQQAGNEAIRTHNGRVRDLQNTYSDNPDVQKGLGTFSVNDPGQPKSAADRAREILERRRGGAGGGPRPFPG